MCIWQAAPLVQEARQQESARHAPQLELFDAQGQVVMPAFIDMHAHFRDPGLTQKEDLESGSRAAAAGGFGTLVLMPNTNPVISSQEAALSNNRRGAEIGLAELFQSVSITRDFGGTDISQLEELDARLVPLITEDGHEVQDSAVMFQAMQIAAKKHIIVSCHCEDPFLAAAARPLRKVALAELEKGNREEAARLLAQADELLRLAEDTATDRNIRLAAQAGCHLHLCHVSTAQSIDIIRQAKARGAKVTCETAPHYFIYTYEKVLGRDADYRMNPPLRDESDRQAVIQGLLDGTIDAIATDHAPHSPGEKADFVSAPNGVVGMETSLAATLTYMRGLLSLSDIVRLMSQAPASILGIDGGAVREGAPADFVLVDLNETWLVDPDKLHGRSKNAVFKGETLTGRVKATYCGGRKVF